MSYSTVPSFAISMLMSLPTSLGNVPQESTWATSLLARLTKESTRFKQNSFASFGPCTWGWSSSSCLQAMATRLGIQNASHLLGPYMPLYIKRKTIHILTVYNYSDMLKYCILILLMLFILVSNTSCDRHLECQISCAKVLWPLDHSATARSPPHPLQVLLQGCTYEANSHELRWPRGRFTCFIWGTSRLWFFFWLSFLAGKLDPSISNSWFCWPCFCFCQWNNEIYYASVVSVNNSVSQSMMLNSITVITRNGICVAEQTGPAWRISIQRHFHPWKLTCIREEPVDSSGVGNTAVFSIFSKAAANTANGGNSTWGWLDQNSWKSDLEGKHTVYWTHPPQKRMHSSHPRVICQVLRRFAKIMKLKSQCKNTAAGRNQITQCLGQILSISALVKPNHCRVPARTDPQKLKTQSHDKDDNMKKNHTW